MALRMEHGDFKPHEADAFELDHVIAPQNLIRKYFNGNQPQKFSPLKSTRYMVIFQNMKFVTGYG